MSVTELPLIKEINQLWEPVYPYLARQIREVYGRTDGIVLEIGPFCGVIFHLRQMSVGDFHLIAAFPVGMAEFFRTQTEGRGGPPEGLIKTDPSLNGLRAASIDLAIFRGALFFPNLFRVDFSAIDRVLKPGGTAFVGGGFGKYTPDTVIGSIGKKSRDFNLAIGKIEVTPHDVRRAVDAARVSSEVSIIREGGLWVVMKK